MISLDSAQSIIKSYQTELPVPVVKIALGMGLRVFEVDGWPNEICGKLSRKGKSFEIYVNADHPNVRRRFTIAHEIAHFVWHSHLIQTEIVDDALYRSGLSNSVETKANAYAADILMPWSKINEAMSAGIGTIEDLAQMFNVSNSAMSIRLGVPFD